MIDPLAMLDGLERTLPAVPPATRLALTRVRQAISQERHHLRELEHSFDRLLSLVQRSAGLVERSEPDALATEILDLLIGLSGAERGLVALVEPGGGWSFIGARSMRGEDLEQPDAEVSRTVIRRALDQREPVLLSDALSEAKDSSGSIHALRLRSVACMPMVREGRTLGFVYLDHRASADQFDARTLSLMQACAPMLSAALDRALRQPASHSTALPGVLTRSEKLAAQLRSLARIARFDVPVLFTGETGSGKGHVARQLHLASPRGPGPFVHVNAGALPESLVESELFGVEAGAYTGARASRPGRFEVASGGTLFLDELDSMPLAVQAKLLVALQERTITRLGSHKTVQVNVRVMAAMGRSPEQAIAEGRLREDLYYRLSVVVVRIPPLRERPEDLELLAEHALERARQRHGLPPLRLSASAREQLRRHRWPGNVRELENAIERSALLSEDGLISSLQLDEAGAPPSGASAPPPEAPADAEAAEAGPWGRRMVISREEFARVWTSCEGDVNAVAARLGVARRSVYRMKQRHGL